MRSRLAFVGCVLLCFAVFPAFGQWASSGANIYNTNSGFVGIGTGSPTTLLHITSDTSPFFLINTNGTCGSCNPSFAYTLNNIAKAYVGIAGASNGGITGTSAGDLFFRSQNQYMRFSTDGGSTTGMKLFLNHAAIGPTAPLYSNATLSVGESADYLIYANNGQATVGYGVTGIVSNGGGYAIYGIATAPSKAGYFSGDVQITGSITKASGTFKIDHPLDPQNKYLSHSFVESPDMMNVYNGTVNLDAEGQAIVQLPAYFEALNQDFRYQLTCIHGWSQVYVADEVHGNMFRIGGGKPGQKVSWQVTGIRHDAWANKHRVQVEEEKPQDERGMYLHPAEHDQPEDRGIDWKKQQAMKPEVSTRQRQ